MGAGGATHLVFHHADLLALAMQPQHGEGKVLAHRPHHPAGAQDHAPAAAAQHCFHRFLAGGLGAAVSA